MYGTKCNINYGFGNTTFHAETIPRITQAFSGFCEPLKSKEEIIYTNHAALPKYKNKTLLVIGGGESTNTLENVSMYDYIWSMNHFYKNPKVKKMKVDLFTVGPEVNLQDTELLDYLYQNETIAAFELHQKWARHFINPDTGQTIEQLWKEADEFYVQKQKLVFQTKFYSQLGAGVRLLIFASEVGFKEISFIGFDGPLAILKGLHAFQPGKKQFPRAVQMYDDTTKMRIFAEQYQVFWNYIQHMYPNVKFTNLQTDNLLHRHIK